jgi:hypothetical protein
MLLCVVGTVIHQNYIIPKYLTFQHTAYCGSRVWSRGGVLCYENEAGQGVSEALKRLGNASRAGENRASIVWGIATMKKTAFLRNLTKVLQRDTLRANAGNPNAQGSIWSSYAKNEWRGQQ